MNNVAVPLDNPFGNLALIASISDADYNNYVNEGNLGEIIKEQLDMKNVAVPLVVYVDGVRKEIGTSLVHYDPFGNLALVASISETEYHDFVDGGLKCVALFTTKE